MASARPVERHLLKRIQQRVSCPGALVTILPPRNETRNERPDRTAVVAHRVVEQAFGRKHVRAPIRADAVPGKMGKGCLCTMGIEKAERSGGGGPHRQVIVGAT